MIATAVSPSAAISAANRACSGNGRPGDDDVRSSLARGSGRGDIDASINLDVIVQLGVEIAIFGASASLFRASR